MSQADVANFYNSIKDNQQLLQELEAIQSPAEFNERAAQLGREQGYNFTANDVDAFVNQKRQEMEAGSGAELSDAELETVAGGKGRTCPADTRVTFCVVISSCFGSKC